MIKFSKIKLKNIAERYKLAEVYIFGSQVSGFFHPESDFDIAVRFRTGLPGPTKRGRVYGYLFSELSLIFKNKKIDLVFLEEVPLHFQFKIVAEGRLIYFSNLEESYNFKEKTINFYRDYKFFIDEFFKGVLETPVR